MGLVGPVVVTRPLDCRSQGGRAGGRLSSGRSACPPGDHPRDLFIPDCSFWRRYSEAIKPMPHWFDKPLRVQSMDRFRGGVTGICMKMLPPSSCGMPLATAAWCGFLRDGIEGRRGLVRRKTFNQRRRRQGKGCSTKTVPGDTSGQGRGMFHPPPRRASSPQGRFPIDTVPCRRQALIGLTEISMKSRFLPVHGIRGNRHLLPAPWKGAGGGRASGRAVGVVDCSH